MKITQTILTLGLSILIAAGLTGNLQANTLEDSVMTASDILSKKQNSRDPIPATALQSAKGVAIFSIGKIGLVVGGSAGDGIVVIRGTPECAPIPLGFSGGSFGAQVGVSKVNLIILLNSDAAVQTFTRPGKVGWNAAASGTVGSENVTKQEGGLLTDKDVTIYKESDGLYGGATIGGAALNVQEDRITDAYGTGVTVNDILIGKVKVPAYALHLYGLMNGQK